MRCGACADKCQFSLGTNDPKEYAGFARRTSSARSLLQARDYTMLGKILGRRVGARSWSMDIVARTFLLRLPVHRNAAAARALLPLRHRHGRNHDDRARVAA